MGFLALARVGRLEAGAVLAAGLLAAVEPRGVGRLEPRSKMCKNIISVMYLVETTGEWRNWYTRRT